MAANQTVDDWLFKEPRAVVKEQLEAALQAQCVGWARKRGWWGRKFQSQSQRSVPDFLFGRSFAPLGLVETFRVPGKLAVEFKRLGQVSTEKQWAEQYDMWLHGWQVEECDNFEKFKRIILAIEERYT